LLAIKQQEQTAYQSLLSNPLRLKKMREDLGVKPKKDKQQKEKEKEERKRLKRERKQRKYRSRSVRHSRTPSPSTKRLDRGWSPIDRGRSRSRSPRAPSSSSSSRPSRRNEEESRYARRRSPDSYRVRSPGRDRGYDDDRYRPGSSYLNARDIRKDDQRRRYDSPPRGRVDYGKRSRSPSPRRRSPPPKRSRYSPPHAPHAQNGQTSGYTQDRADRASRLAAMQVNANSTSEDRQKRLAALLEKEKADLAADERAREKSKGMSSFLSQEQKRVFGGTGGLEDRMRRGTVGMVVEAD
jgi:hypothetical protein